MIGLALRLIVLLVLYVPLKERHDYVESLSEQMSTDFCVLALNWSPGHIP